MVYHNIVLWYGSAPPPQHHTFTILILDYGMVLTIPYPCQKPHTTRT
jgi:hypothetical protein